MTKSTTKVVSIQKHNMWTGSRAVAEAVRLADVDVIAAYPIRPYTGIMNALAGMLAKGQFSAEYVICDSEHSQFEVVKHASAVGARTFVGSSGTGLAYGTEAAIVTALGQVPVVGIVGCRSLDDPGNFGMEWNDTFLFRDSGWMIGWAKDPQEALEMVLVAYRVSEDPRISLPSFVALDGAAITHIASPVKTPTKENVDEFLPPYKPLYPLDPLYDPVAKAIHIAPSLIGPEQRKVVDVAMKRAKKEVIPQAWKLWNEITGSNYPTFIDEQYIDDADYILVSMGAYSKNVEYITEKLRAKNIKVGSIRLRYFRPFPADELRKACENAKAVGVIDFSYSFGSPFYGSVLFNEIKASLYGMKNSPLIMSFIFAGGREMIIEDLEKAANLLIKGVKAGKIEKPVRWLTLRGEDI